MSRFADWCDAFLARAGLERGPWLVVAFAAGIASWFALDRAWQWQGVIGLALLTALFAGAHWRGREGRSALFLAVASLSFAYAGGVALVWAKSELVGARPLDGPRYGTFHARILERSEEPGEGRVRLVLALRDATEGRAVRVRANLDPRYDSTALREGAVIRMRARLMPPSPPLVPGAYDFARYAWFEGLSATGTVLAKPEVIAGAPEGGESWAGLQRRLSHHVRGQLEGSAGALAATLASGDRGAIPPEDEEAMRDAGLTHLLSISGVHVSALMAVAYALAFRLLAFWPWLALRVRVPLAAGLFSALAGIAYTLLTGAEVPTVRSCIGALLVLFALTLGREPLSLRLLAVVAFVVLAIWPEALAGPSFQMSFAAVLTIVAVHQSAPVKAFLAPRAESWFARLARQGVMLFVTGMIIELALMPIVLFHFHRTGIYGALANVVAIPLVTFVSMPLVGLSLLADLCGLGAPVWWAAGQSLDALLVLAHAISSAPRATSLVPHFSVGLLLLFVSGGLWLALWRGTARLLGIAPILLSGLLLGLARPPDVMITRDGRDLAIAGAAAQDSGLVVLRGGSDESYTHATLAEFAAYKGKMLKLKDWEKARCSEDFCAFSLVRDGRAWHFLVSSSKRAIEERALSAACAQADIVISDRWLPRSCTPRWLKADRNFLEERGGTAIYLDDQHFVTVGQDRDDHGW